MCLRYEKKGCQRPRIKVQESEGFMQTKSKHLVVKMPLHKLCATILLVIFIALVRSAPSLNKSPQSLTGQVILANSDLVSNDTSKNSHLSQHLLNSAQINSLTSNVEQELDTSLLSVTTQSSIRSMESKLIVLAKTNTSSGSNFSLAISRHFNDLHDLVTDLMSRMLDTAFTNNAVQHTSMVPSPDALTFQPRHARTHHRLISIDPSLYHFASPSQRIFLAFSRFFSNL